MLYIFAVTDLKQKTSDLPNMLFKKSENQNCDPTDLTDSKTFQWKYYPIYIIWQHDRPLDLKLVVETTQ